MSDEIFEKVKSIIEDTMETGGTEISPEIDLVKDLGAGSVDVICMVMELEEKFDAEVPDEDIVALSTVGKIVDYIEKNTSE